jgi:hypothetical protein
VCNADFAPGTVRVAGVGLAGLTETTALAEITFSANAPRGDCTSLIVEVTELTGTDDTPIDPAIASGRVCVVGCADATGDGYVGIQDLSRMLFETYSHPAYNAALDLNGDGDLDAVDLQIAVFQFGARCP